MQQQQTTMQQPSRQLGQQPRQQQQTIGQIATGGARGTAGSEVGFLGAAAVARLIAQRGVAASIGAIAARIEVDFRRWPEFDKVARIASHAPDGTIELMPIADAQTWSFKYVNGHPANVARGRPTVAAFGALARVADGMPVLISELTLTTALRTAAMSAVAARRLARPGSRVMALIGNGSQSEFQAIAFAALLGITSLRLYDVDPAATRKLVRNLAAFDIATTICDSVAEACRGADIVTTATADKKRATVLTPEMIEPGMHLNAIGGDCPGKTELDPAIVAAASVFVEFEPQTRIEGEIQQLPADFPVTEFWRVLAGEHPGRTAADQVTLFDSVGFALEDFSALGFLHAAAAEAGLIQPLDLIPTPADPRDLFGTLIAAA
ncbi:MAG: ornithine cyclodeaminase [Lautropia sp.]